MKAADAAAAGRKPWRYYYVMAFPLTGSSIVSPDKLQEMTEVTTAIEQREERYLVKVAARNAALEAEKKTAEQKQKPTLAFHVAWALRRLHFVSILLLLAGLGVLYKLHAEHKAHEITPQPLVQITAGCLLLLLVVNVGGWVAAYRCSIGGARVLLVVELGLIVGLAFLLDEVNTVRGSQIKLQDAVDAGRDGLTKNVMDLILNGAEPSLVQRFVYDAPNAFLQWLRVRCSTKKTGYASVAIDKHEFFSPFWDQDEKKCVVATLVSCLRIGGVIQAVVITGLVLTALEVFFTGMLLAVSDPMVPMKKAKKRRKQRARSKASSSSLTPQATANAPVFRFLMFGTALFGSSNSIASANLLGFCSITDFDSLFTWLLVACLLSGLSSLFGVMLVRWRQQLAGFFLVVAVASEIFMMLELIKMVAKHFGARVAAESDQDRIDWLRNVYGKASAQTCFSIKRWISHVCVDTPLKHRAAFDGSCQRELTALLLVSFNAANSYLAGSIGVKLMVLIQLIFPTLHRAVVAAVSFLCCLSRDQEPITATKNNLAQKLIMYSDAEALYLTSIRYKEALHQDASDAFRKEWSTRTGRELTDDNKTTVAITASDFGAMVRTLVLRRLTAVCKLDVSLRVSDNGELLLVRIFASDNLLLATLCDLETYSLQFADAIDPGRRFWHNKKEVLEDQKVLDAHTAKYKLKLLLKGNAVPPKEAVWQPGESLARVSARIHAISRIMRVSKGQIHPNNQAPAFVSYSPMIQRQFLYKKYPNRLDIPDTYRRSAVLRTVDCIRLTRRIINMEFDMRATIANELVTSIHCLHSSSRYDWNSRDALASSWIAFWRSKFLPGEFRPDKHPVMSLIGRFAPFRQPLQDIRDYFGELIAFYFAWFAFYSNMMVSPVAITILLAETTTDHSMFAELWVLYTSNQETNKSADTLSFCQLMLGLGVLIWGFVFAKLWQRKSVWYQLQWGVDDSNSATNVSTNEFYLRSYRDVENKASMPTVPGFIRGIGACSACCWKPLSGFCWWLTTWLCILMLGTLNLLLVFALILAQGSIVRMIGERLAVRASCLCQVLLVQCNEAGIPRLARALSWWESPLHFTDHRADQRFVIKNLFVLELINNYTGLVLLAVREWGVWPRLVRWVALLQPLYSSYNTNIGGHTGVFVEMELLISALILTRITSHVFMIVYTLSRSSAKQFTETFYTQGTREDETLLPPYPGPHENYAQAITQLGLVVTFSGACPLVPVLALLECAVKLRSDAVDLCYVRQRPEPENGENNDDDVGLGLWAPFVLVMLKISVPFAVALALFTANNFANISVERRAGLWIVVVACILQSAQIFWALVPRESRVVEEARARRTLLVERYFGPAEAAEQKPPTNQMDQGKSLVDNETSDVQETLTSAEQSLRHYTGRLDLLHRLNAAIKDESRFNKTPAASKMDPTEGSEKMREEERITSYLQTIPDTQSLYEKPSEVVVDTDDSSPPSQQSVMASSHDAITIPPIDIGGDVSVRSPLLKMFPSKSHAGNSGDDQAEEIDSAPQMQFSSRLDFQSQKPRSSVSRISASAESRHSSVLGDDIPELPPPRRLSKLFKRVQPSELPTPAPQRAPQAELVPPPTVARTNIESRVAEEAATLREQFDFVSTAHEETTMERAIMEAQRRQTQVQPPSPPSGYTGVVLAGLEAVDEAASRRDFDFSADD